MFDWVLKPIECCCRGAACCGCTGIDGRNLTFEVVAPNCITNTIGEVVPNGECSWQYLNGNPTPPDCELLSVDLACTGEDTFTVSVTLMGGPAAGDGYGGTGTVTSCNPFLMTVTLTPQNSPTQCCDESDVVEITFTESV